MKKFILAASITIIAAGGMAFADSTTKTEAKGELRPTQKIMQARNAWMKSMNDNYNSGNIGAITQDAQALGAQTKQVAQKLTNAEAKEYTLAISALTKDLVANIAKKDNAATLVSLREIKNKCGSCHLVFRDKK